MQKLLIPSAHPAGDSSTSRHTYSNTRAAFYSTTVTLDWTQRWNLGYQSTMARRIREYRFRKTLNSFILKSMFAWLAANQAKVTCKLSKRFNARILPGHTLHQGFMYSSKRHTADFLDVNKKRWSLPLHSFQVWLFGWYFVIYGKAKGKDQILLRLGQVWKGHCRHQTAHPMLAGGGVEYIYKGERD